jgi:hypothetical protein
MKPASIIALLLGAAVIYDWAVSRRTTVVSVPVATSPTDDDYDPDDPDNSGAPVVAPPVAVSTTPSIPVGDWVIDGMLYAPGALEAISAWPPPNRGNLPPPGQNTVTPTDAAVANNGDDY